MLHFSMRQLLARALAFIAALALTGVILKIFAAILASILPTALTHVLDRGRAYLQDVISRSAGPIGALAILALLLFIIIGRE